MLALGMMTGTSLDALDLALVSFDPNKPLAPISFTAEANHPLPSDLRDTLLTLSQTDSISLQQLGQTEHRLGKFYAQAVQTFIDEQQLTQQDVAVIGCHGQTIRHAPNDELGFTYQIGDLHHIIAQTHIPVVGDFRRRDLALDGQGAPLVPLFHQAQWRHPEQDRIILNIGGMANISYLPADPNTRCSGFDTGPGNVLLDHLVYQHYKQPFDDQGALGRKGIPNQALLTHCLADPFFQQTPPKSCGREQFNPNWLTRQLAQAPCPNPNNQLATLYQLTATTITQAINQLPPLSDQTELIVCGGGARNTFLMECLAKHLPQLTIKQSDTLGIPTSAVEACAIAWLAIQRFLEKPLNYQLITGAKSPALYGTLLI